MCTEVIPLLISFLVYRPVLTVCKLYVSSTDTHLPHSGVHPQPLAPGLASNRHYIDSCKWRSRWMNATVLRLTDTTENTEVNPQGFALEAHCRHLSYPHSALVSPSAFSACFTGSVFPGQAGRAESWVYFTWVWSTNFPEGNLAYEYLSFSLLSGDTLEDLTDPQRTVLQLLRALPGSQEAHILPFPVSLLPFSYKWFPRSTPK